MSLAGRSAKNPASIWTKATHARNWRCQGSLRLRILAAVFIAPLGLGYSGYANGAGPKPTGKGSSSGKILSQFNSLWDFDVAQATDGNYVLSTAEGYLSVYQLTTGQLLSQTGALNVICPAANPLPVCSQAQFFGDWRVRYDPDTSRWFISTFDIGSSPVQFVLLVSTGSYPGDFSASGWYKYQFPLCGINNTQDASDQPQMGIGKNWVVVNGACAFGPGLNVVSKSALLSGTATLSNWSDFTDAVSNGPFDNPTMGYYSGDVWLAHADVNSADYVTITLSTISGTSAPVYTPRVAMLTTTAYTGGASLPLVSAPGHPHWMDATGVGTKVHSAGVYQGISGAFVLGVTTMPDGNDTNGTQTIPFAYAIGTGAWKYQIYNNATLNLEGSMASEIVMPNVNALGYDEAVIAVSDSERNFYPGMKTILWNVDSTGGPTPPNWGTR